MLGDTVELKQVGKGKVVLIRARKPKKDEDRVVKREDFVKSSDREPRRTGRPENPSPEEMKLIWNE
jgi:hypothetical protein